MSDEIPDYVEIPLENIPTFVKNCELIGYKGKLEFTITIV